MRARISAIESARSRWATWRAERLTATSSGRSSGRSSCQSRAWRQARLLHPAADRLDQPAVLGDRDELAGVEQAALGVVPAHQRLDAGDLAGAEAIDRLVVQLELVALERVAQLALGLEAAHGAGPHLGVEELAAGAAALLGPVHRGVGVADQQLGVDGSRVGGPGDGDADAGGDEVVGAAHRVGLGEGGGDAIGDRDRLVLVGEAVDEDAELVAAEAGDDVAGPQVGAQPRRDRPQQLVAGVVADAVVDQLEVVEVEEEDPDRRARDGAARERVAERVDEAEPVGQAGERVVQDAVAQGLVGAVALDRVGEHVRRGLDEVDVLRGEVVGFGGVDVEHAEGALLAGDRHGEAAAHADHPQRRRHREAPLARPVVDDHVQARLQRGARVRVAGGRGAALGPTPPLLESGAQVEATAVATRFPDAGRVDPSISVISGTASRTGLGSPSCSAWPPAAPPPPAGPLLAAAPARRSCAR